MPGIIRKFMDKNKNKIWFRRKLYGWGWVPVTWQGWLVTLLYVALIVLAGLTIDGNSPRSELAFTFIIPVALITVALVRILYRKGEPPRWQWGKDIERDR